MSTGKIIVFNGASSSGKSSILHQFQSVAEEPWLEAGVDQFIKMLPDRFSNLPLWQIFPNNSSQTMSLGSQLVLAMHGAVREMAKAGLNVLVDQVLADKSCLDDCVNAFYDLPAFFIGVKCPLEILEERERNRINGVLGLARFQFDRVHRYAHYDFEVDSSVYSISDCANLIKDFVHSGNLPSAFKELQSKIN